MKRKNKKILNKKMTFYLVIFGVISILFLYMYQTVTVDLLMRDLHTLQRQKQLLLSETNRLEGQVEKLSNIDRIPKLAAERYNMVPNNDKVLVLKMSGSKELEKAKKQFARRFNQKRKKINLAGVQ